MDSTSDNESFFDQEILDEFIVEANEHLANIEQQLLEVEKNGKESDGELLNRIFRGVHSIKGTAGFLGLETINKLAHSLENVLNLMRESKLEPSSDVIDVTLKAADTLCQLVADVENSNQFDISTHTSALNALAEPKPKPKRTAPKPTAPTIPSPFPRPTIIKKQKTGSKPAADPKSSAEEPTTDESSEAANRDSKSTQALPNQTKPASQNTASRTVGTTKNLPTQENQTEPAGTKTTPPSSSASSTTTPPTTTPPTTQPAQPAGPPTQSAAEPPDSGATPQRSANEGTIRVPVETLDYLMNLAGELVVSRNQLLQTVSTDDKAGIESVVARVNQVTGEVQDAIMQTRMQPIGNVFDRFTRQVRDLSNLLGKACRLEIEGKDVEVDKSIIEAIGDPLTHLIRNSVDHGIEPPADRKYMKKPPEGTISLRAFHQGGKVKIEISDDGKGIDPDVIKASAISKGIVSSDESERMDQKEVFALIFRPGFSTTESVSDVSGRGVGMDVVRTNIEKLGGMVEVESRQGQGTTFTVTLPLTLAIIPSMIVTSANEIFAIPQVNIVELVRIPGDQIKSRIGCVNRAEVLRLRDKLLPLVRLGESLGISSKTARACDLDADNFHAETMNIIVVDVGHMQYGLIVDSLQDSEEIVIKPLGKHISNISCLAGATILGDGRIALIVDVSGVADDAKLQVPNELKSNADASESSNELHNRKHSLLLFRNHQSERFAVPMDFVARIESARLNEFETVGKEKILLSRGKSIPVLCIEDHLTARQQSDVDPVYIVIFAYDNKEYGLIAPILDDICELEVTLDSRTLKEPGVAGSFVHDGHSVRWLNLQEFIASAKPDWFEDKPESQPFEKSTQKILLVDDSNFFRKQVRELLLQHGFQVEEATDGRLAWEKLESGDTFDLIVTDIEMPNLNGFQFSQRVKTSRHQNVPVIALTSLHSHEYADKANAIGIDDYQVKLDRKKLIESIDTLIASKQVSHPGHSREEVPC